MKYTVEVELIPNVIDGDILWAWKATAYKPGEDLIGTASAVLYSDVALRYKVNASDQAYNTMARYLHAKDEDNLETFEVEV